MPYADQISQIHTGGTISMKEVDSSRGEPSPHALSHWAKNRIGHHEYLFGNGKDSSQITLKDILPILRAVKTQLDQKRIPIITHGTDTIGMSGGVIAELFPKNAVILTGSFHPPNVEKTDATNFLEAILLAEELVEKPHLPRVPYVVMNGSVYLSSSIVKLDLDFQEGRRGFRSHFGKVGEIRDDRFYWKDEFLLEFENARQYGLQETQVIRDKILSQIENDSFEPSKIDLIFANQHTPVEFIQHALNRLEVGFTDALIVHGELSANHSLSARIQKSIQKGKVFVQGMNFPEGYGVYRLFAKLFVYLQSKELQKILNFNFAGEIIDQLEDESYRATIERSNFYESEDVVRSFLIYAQDPELFCEQLKQEISRLERLSEEGKFAELVIEGTGNGHVYIEDQTMILDLLRYASELGIQVMITTRVKDATPNSNYSIGKIMKSTIPGLKLSSLPGREYLSQNL